MKPEEKKSITEKIGGSSKNRRKACLLDSAAVRNRADQGPKQGLWSTGQWSSYFSSPCFTSSTISVPWAHLVAPLGHWMVERLGWQSPPVCLRRKQVSPQRKNLVQFPKEGRRNLESLNQLFKGNPQTSSST